MAAKLPLFMPHAQIANQIEQLLWNKFFNTISSLESEQMKLLLYDQMTAKLSLLMPHFQVAYQTEQLLAK